MRADLFAVGVALQNGRSMKARSAVSSTAAAVGVEASTVSVIITPRGSETETETATERERPTKSLWQLAGAAFCSVLLLVDHMTSKLEKFRKTL